MVADNNLRFNQIRVNMNHINQIQAQNKRDMQMNQETGNDDFFIRYYIGHKGLYGHEFLDFELDSSGRLKYLNNSQYKSDELIRKQVYVSQTVIDQMKRIIQNSGIMDCDDKKWPKPDKIGKQQLQVRIGDKRINLQTSKIGSYGEVQKTEDPDGLTIFFYLVQDIKCFVFSMVNLHFRIKPI